MSFKPLTLHPDRDAWEIQPGETTTAFGRFVLYRDMRPTQRTCVKVAESCGVKRRSIEQQADAHQWRERAKQYDAHRDQQRRARNEERDNVASEIQMAAVVAASEVTKRSVDYVKDAGVVLEPKDLRAWVQMMSDLRKMALDNPDQIVELTTRDGSPFTAADVDEFEGLNPEQKRHRAQEIVEGVRRLYAVDGGAA